MLLEKITRKLFTPQHIVVPWSVSMLSSFNSISIASFGICLNREKLLKRKWRTRWRTRWRKSGYLLDAHRIPLISKIHQILLLAKALHSYIVSNTASPPPNWKKTLNATCFLFCKNTCRSHAQSRAVRTHAMRRQVRSEEFRTVFWTIRYIVSLSI